ncbi:DNA ligase D [Lysinibacillus sp. 2017]|uniref:DNA ligase D n=1 Tax=unclassified Lysinibacillus TaxID=2636778 RepID=UPI000D5277E3|nr:MULTISPECIES: DNA ligase D [unclassified Lysinibacillus]AWE07445.1 DNA ligase D [Lysinibacillus sp. 2017]TGN36609.1 DNA ligase D [Lysinibacillus sp. S2017]
MKPMLLTDSSEVPAGNGWLYETKYDGFRCILTWEKGEKTPILKSRNDNLLDQKFPEIIRFCEGIYNDIEPYLPLVLDGELVYLTNDFQGNFSIVQKRGRMQNSQNIESHAESFPCHYIVFDILKIKGLTKTDSHLVTRKQVLTELFGALSLPKGVNYKDSKRLQAIDVFEDSALLWQKIKTYNGEGIIAKKRTSQWLDGTRSKNWLKIKNWKYVDVILIRLDLSNGFFDAVVYKGDVQIEVVTFKHGLKEEEKKTLIKMFEQYGTLRNDGVWEIPASICVSVACIDFDGSKLREPKFHAFKFNVKPSECNWQQMQRQLNPIPECVFVTHPDKPVFPTIGIKKDDYLLYLQIVAPYMLPFLQKRRLTVIRYPHGAPGENFYQKNYQDNIPSFVTTHMADDNNYVLCNNLETLLWLGNQLAIEFHIPFQPIQTDKPTEIVFDLDPPSVEAFHLAVSAALNLKTILDHFGLQSFVKTSGGKGMQVYIPLPFNTFTYEETGVFTEFVCKFLVQQYPDWFTTERFKKNRGNRLYLDYVQHKEGKTIVAPYSARGNAKGLIATPLHWDEVNEQLSPDKFTIPKVIDRINNFGDLLRNFREVGENQDFKSVLNQISGVS